MKSLEQVMKEHPQLTIFGFRQADYRNYNSDWKNDFTKESYLQKIEKERSDLKKNEEGIVKIMDFLRMNVGFTKKVGRLNCSSYGLKHIVEDYIGYIANGQFIAAALMCEYPYKIDEPNAYFGMSKKCIKTLQENRSRNRGEKKPSLCT